VECGALLMECRVFGAQRVGSERVCVRARESPPLARDLLVEHGALLMECRALLMEFRALLMEFRALLWNVGLFWWNIGLFG